MTCAQVRGFLSARLDGEDPEEPATTLAEVDSHVGGCAGCAAWLARAEHVTRTVRVQAIEVPDLTASVMAAVTADPVRADLVRAASAASAGSTARGEVRSVDPARISEQSEARRHILRWAVALTAIAQIVLALPILLGGVTVPGDPHLTREMASLDVALAVGFLLAAYRPERARAFVPVAFVLAACLALTSFRDVVNASTAPVHEIGHLATVVQAALLWGLGRTAGTRRPSLPGLTAAGSAATR